MVGDWNGKAEPFKIHAEGWALIFAASVAICFIGYTVWSLNQPVLPCPTMVAMSRTCMPFGCEHTYVNARGQDTGECR